MTRWPWLLAAALLGLACCATRFHGLAVVLAVAGLCLPSWKAKLAVAGPSLAGAVGLAAIAPAGFVAATFGWHPGLIWPCLVATLTVQSACVGGLALLAIALGDSRNAKPILTACLAYLGGMVVASAVFDAVPSNLELTGSRPFVLSSVLATLLILAWLIQAKPRVRAWGLAGLAAFTLLSGYLFCKEWAKPGAQGFNSQAFKDGGGAKAWLELEPGVNCWTNNPDGLSFLTSFKRVAFGLPRTDGGRDFVRNTPDLTSEPGVVIFYKMSRPYFMPIESIERYIDTNAHGQKIAKDVGDAFCFPVGGILGGVR